MNIEQYKTAILIREFEQLLLRLFGQGKLNGTVHTCVGQELIPTLLMPFIKKEDCFFSNHRGHGHYIVKTDDIKGLLAEIMDRRVRSREDLSEDLQLPVFAVIRSNSSQGNASKNSFKALSRRLFRPRKGLYAR